MRTAEQSLLDFTYNVKDELRDMIRIASEKFRITMDRNIRQRSELEAYLNKEDGAWWDDNGYISIKENFSNDLMVLAIRTNGASVRIIYDDMEEKVKKMVVNGEETQNYSETEAILTSCLVELEGQSGYEPM